MTIMSFFCRLLNGRCATEPPEPKTRETPKTPSANMTAAASPPPSVGAIRPREGVGE